MSNAKAFAYIRYSSDKQSDGSSIERQTELAEAFARRHGLDLQPVIVDAGVSANDGNNLRIGKIRQWLDEALAGRYPAGTWLLIENGDRFSRGDPLTAGSMLQQLTKLGIKIGTTGDGQIVDASNFMRFLPTLIQLAIANDGNEAKKRLIRRAWALHKADSIKEQKAISRWCPAWLRVVDGKYVADPDRVAVVQRIYREYIEQHGINAIAHRLNADGVPTFAMHDIQWRKPRSNGWHAGYVAKILKSREVLGEWVPKCANSDTGKRQVKDPAYDQPVIDFFPQVIDHATFEKARATALRRANTGGRKTQAMHNLFAGLIYCAHCNGKMYAAGRRRWKGSRLAVSIDCDNAKRRIKGADGMLLCDRRVRWDLTKLENPILGLVKYLILDDSGHGSKVAEIESQIAAKTTQRQRASDKGRTILLHDPEDTFGALAELRRQITQLTDEIDRHQTELTQLRGNGTSTQHVAEINRLTTIATKLEPGPERYDARSKIATAIPSVVDMIACDPTDGKVFISVGGAFFSAVLDRHGNVLASGYTTGDTTHILGEDGNDADTVKTPRDLVAYQASNSERLRIVLKRMKART